MPEPHWSGRIPTSSGGGGGASSLTDLTDVTGTPGPGVSPVGDENGQFPLVPIMTQQDLEDTLAQTVWRKIGTLTDPWQPSNPTAVLTPDGITLGPYADGAAAGGSIRYLGLNGQPLSAVRSLAYRARYTSDTTDLDEGAAPYLRIYTQDTDGNPHDAAFTPGSQPFPGLGQGALQEYVATAGTWRYDADDSTGGVPFADIVADHGQEIITKIAITVGWTAGVNLASLLRWWQTNEFVYVFVGE